MDSSNTHIRYVDTSTASVKMTGGVLVTDNTMEDSSSSEAEFDYEVSHEKLEQEKIDGKPSLITSHTNTDSPSLRLYRKGVSRQVKRNIKSNNSSKSITDITQRRSPLSETRLEHNNILIQQKSGEADSVTYDVSTATKKYINGSSANHLPVNLRISGSQLAGTSTRVHGTVADKLKSAAKSRHPVYLPASKVDNRTGLRVRAAVVLSSSSSCSSLESCGPPGRPQLRASTSFVGPENGVHPERLSQSLENSQESTLKQWGGGLLSSNSLSAISDVAQRRRTRPTRVNPFNNDLLVDEDHFSDSVENYFRTGRRSTGSTKSSSASQGPDLWQEESDITFAELGLSEDHFSHPQGHFGLSGAEELELAIENCKEMIKEAAPGSEKQKNLIMKLVQLRIKLQEVKEGPEPVPENVKVILSHKMLLKNSRSSKYYCERCNSAIWGILQVWYRCTECGYRCHEKCLQQILRTCAKAKVLENPMLITEICPKDSNGLAGQNFRCWECQIIISYKNGHNEPRMCDYTGHYYCEFCHWNNSYVIPARVLHNWDFVPRKVCRASKQFLKLMQKKAVLRIQDINPMLFVYIDQLNEIKKLREEMMIMKKYILSCASARSAKLLLLLESRQHFVESSDRYSMQDLLDAEDVLLPELVNIHSTWAQHIKVECERCQGRGFCCELCTDKEVLFPFDSTAVVCAKCSAVLHRHCFAKSSTCPRCERRQKKKAIMSEDSSSIQHSKS